MIFAFVGFLAPIVSLIFFLPMFSSNEKIRSWAALDCLTISGSIAAGPWAYALGAEGILTPWHLGAPLIAGACTHFLWPSAPTKLIAGICILLWLLAGLGLTFANF